MAVVGRSLLILGLCRRLYGVGASIYGARGGGRAWVDSGRRAMYVLAGMTAIAFVILDIAFLSSNFSYNIVADRLEHDDADLLPCRRDLGHAAGIAAAVGAAALVVVEPGAVPDPPPGARDRPVRAGGPVRAVHVLHRAHRAVRQPVRDQRQPARRGRRPGPAAAPHDHDDPPPDAVLGLHAAADPVRVRGRRADQRPPERRVDPGDAPLRARRLAVSRDRHPARRPLVLHRARLGRLLGLGSGRERGADAVAVRDRLHPLDHDPGEAGDAEGLERLAGPDDRHARDRRHVPGPLGDPELDPRVRL